MIRQTLVVWNHRAKKGRPPLLSHTVVRVMKRTVHKGETLGGTHASPHLRRGHLRHLPFGKVVPVAPCVIGGARDIQSPLYRLG
ncbi:MAG: hypothetical protein VR70_11115 [Rhodospirillaceae bacterium BRH_c57]|nr:MAG: hypothetical protein VR70_11115 [Rhodospirillaceae bacterium BRH_c57]